MAVAEAVVATVVAVAGGVVVLGVVDLGRRVVVVHVEGVPLRQEVRRVLDRAAEAGHQARQEHRREEEESHAPSLRNATAKGKAEPCDSPTRLHESSGP